MTYNWLLFDGAFGFPKLGDTSAPNPNRQHGSLKPNWCHDDSAHCLPKASKILWYHLDLINYQDNKERKMREIVNIEC